VSPLELVGDFERIAEELRSARPLASNTLRERVAELVAAEPAGPRWSFQWPSRRLVLALAAAALLASLVAAGLTRAPNKPRAKVLQATLPHRTAQAGAGSSDALRGRLQGTPATVFGAAKVPSANPARLQRYQATLRLRVQDVESLSSATRRAMTLARRLGGYVGEVQYTTRGGKRGGARIVLRVPVGSIQQALATLTGLGTILQQQTGILDVTRRADREAQQIAKLERELETASPQAAPLIRAHLRTLRVKHQRLLRSAQLARIVVTLTTPVAQAATPQTGIRKTLDDAGGVLLRELQFLLYALVVAGPLLLLGAAGLATARAARKRSDRRLLERA
jgi:Domain of unknown function (DUF4349)